MYYAVIIHGKSHRQSEIAANDCPIKHSRFFITDHTTKVAFRVDTGSDLCVFPKASVRERRQRTHYQLYAANGSPINTYDWIHLNLNLGLRRVFQWRFVVAVLNKPIHCADFLIFYHLLIDMRNHRLIDGITQLTTTALPAGESTANIASVKAISGDSVSQLIT